VESKGRVAHRLLAEFAAKRREDLFGLVLFSASAVPVMSFTQNPEMIQAAISAGGIGRALSETDVGRGLLTAAEFFDHRVYAGSRLIVMVSDGGAQLEPEMKERLTTILKRNRVGLYWIYIRSTGSRGLHPEAGEAEGTPPSSEHALHTFFEGLGVPYRAYEAEDPDALKRAISDVGRLENLPIQYQELLPRADLATLCYTVAAAGCLLLFAAALLRVRRWP
jgi:mxaC protein